MATVSEEDVSGTLVPLHPRPVRDLAVAEIVLVRQTDRLLSPAAERIIQLVMTTTATF
jgi:hypothetical protein